MDRGLLQSVQKAFVDRVSNASGQRTRPQGRVGWCTWNRGKVTSEGGQVAYPNFSLYHATKWGIEGFIESVAQEVAPFGIEFTIAEPGPAKTGFRAGLVKPPAMPAYEATPAGDVRRAVETGSFKLIGNAAKMAAAMIASAERSPAPRRLVMGSTSYVAIRAALESRLVELDAQKERKQWDGRPHPKTASNVPQWKCQQRKSPRIPVLV